MKIGQISKRYHLSRRQIRHYEALGLVGSSREESSNYRVYDDDTVNRFEIILLLKNLGFSLAEIKTILEHPNDSDIRLLFEKKAEAIRSEQSRLSNAAQILESVSTIIKRNGVDTFNFTELIKEQLYIHNQNERIVPMNNNDMILFEFDLSIIPLFEEDCGKTFLAQVKEMRESTEKETGVKINTIRMRDNVDMENLSTRLLINNKTIFYKTYAQFDREFIAKDIIANISAALRENIETVKLD